MSKPKSVRGLEDFQAQAVTRNMRVSPRKLNLVAQSIRNLPAGRALADLTFSKRRIALQVKKTLESAIANAENNHQLDVDRLVVKLAEVGRGIVMKRFHARGRGRSATVEKWFSHLKIVVEERDAAVKPARDTRPKSTGNAPANAPGNTPVGNAPVIEQTEPAGETV